MPRKVEGKKEKTPKNMELYCKKRQKLEKSFKIQPIFTQENVENSKCPYLLNKNVSEALNAFFVVSIFAFFSSFAVPKGQSYSIFSLILQLFPKTSLDFKAFPCTYVSNMQCRRGESLSPLLGRELRVPVRRLSNFL